MRRRWGQAHGGDAGAAAGSRRMVAENVDKCRLRAIFGAVRLCARATLPEPYGVRLARDGSVSRLGHLAREFRDLPTDDLWFEACGRVRGGALRGAVAVLRIVRDAAQDEHLQRCLPADVSPLLFIFAPQDGHFTDFTANLPQTVIKASIRRCLPASSLV